MPDSESTDVFCFGRVGTGTIHSSRSRSMKVLWEWSPGRRSLRNILLETSSRCYDCNKHIAEQINVQNFLPMILFVNYNSCMCFQDIFCIISHKICVSLQLQRWINSTLRNNETNCCSGGVIRCSRQNNLPLHFPQYLTRPPSLSVPILNQPSWVC